MAIAWFSSALAGIDDVPRPGDPRDAAGVLQNQSAQSSAHTEASAASGPADANVAAPNAPPKQELTEHNLYQFVAHHATVHYVDDPTARNILRWRGGRQSVCPLTVGLSAADDAFVTARIRAVAGYVGAPVQSDPNCKGNVQVIVTKSPQEIMNKVLKWATVYFRNRYSGGMRDLIKFKSGAAIQGWYMTTRGGAIVTNTDVALVDLDLLPVWPEITQNYLGGSSSGGGIGIVIEVVDATKIVGTALTTLADYAAVLALSVAQSPDHCDALPSILDLTSSSCGERETPTEITAGDIAFLKSLYHLDTGLGPSPSRVQIQVNMMQQFR